MDRRPLLEQADHEDDHHDMVLDGDKTENDENWGNFLNSKIYIFKHI